MDLGDLGADVPPALSWVLREAPADPQGPCSYMSHCQNTLSGNPMYMYIYICIYIYITLYSVGITIILTMAHMVCSWPLTGLPYHDFGGYVCTVLAVLGPFG